MQNWYKLHVLDYALKTATVVPQEGTTRENQSLMYTQHGKVVVSHNQFQILALLLLPK